MKDIRKFLPTLMLFLLVLSACNGENQQEPTSKKNAGSQNNKVLHLNASSEIPGLNPTTADNELSFKAINQVFEGLYRLDQEGKPQLAMAAKEPKVSDDHKEYIFKIRKDATWSNGSPVTADDFEYAWKKAVNPDTGAAYGPQFEEIVAGASDILSGDKPVDQLGVKALDEKKLKVTLEEPVPYFKELLTTAIFFPQPKSFIKKQRDQYAMDSEHTLYNGPFVLDDWGGSGDSWTYKKNDHYWDKKSVNVDKIKVNVVDDTRTAINLYKKGQLDRVELTGDFVDKYASDDDYHSNLTGSVKFLKMNQGKNKKETNLSNEHIRKALNMAVDRKVIVHTILNNGSTVLRGLVAKGISENPKSGQDFRKENGDLVRFHPEQAKKQWKQGLQDLDKDKLNFTLTTSNTNPSKTIAENLKHQWESRLPGLSIKINNVPPKQSIDDNVHQNYELLLTGWDGDYPDAMTYLNLFITDSPGNHTGYSDDKYDKLVLKSKSSLADKPMVRWHSLLKAERRLIGDSAVLVPLYQSSTTYLQKNNVKNLTTYPVSAPNYKWVDITN